MGLQAIKSFRILLAAALLAGGFSAAAAAAELVAFKIVDESSIPDSLTGKAGDPANGRKVVINRKQGQLPWLP